MPFAVPVISMLNDFGAVEDWKNTSKAFMGTLVPGSVLSTVAAMPLYFIPPTSQIPSYDWFGDIVWNWTLIGAFSSAMASCRYSLKFMLFAPSKGGKMLLCWGA